MTSTKLPAYQWYPGDWRKDPAVQSLDYEARGIWRECLDFMHETSDRGWLVFEDGSAMRDDDIARMLGIDEAKWKQTRSKLEARRICEIRHDGAVGNRRMAKDEATRRARAEAGRAGGTKSRPPSHAPEERSKMEANTEAKRGSSVSSSLTTTTTTSQTEAKAKQNAEAFETWWDTYPRREGSNPKKPAREKWTSAVKRVSVDELQAGAERFRRYCDAEGTTGTRFVPMASSWLKQERWEEEFKLSSNNGNQPITLANQW